MAAETSGPGEGERDTTRVAGKLTPERARRARTAWRDWRRARPFLGGLLLALAGLELMALPLLSLVSHGSLRVVIYIGVGGISGVVLGGLLITCGVMIWLHQVQRTFYSVAGVLLALVSLIATNLGGFFVGMLLGIVGGSLSFAWTPGQARADSEPLPEGAAPRSGGRLLAVPLVPLILAGWLAGGAARMPGATPAPSQSACDLPPILSFLCPPPLPPLPIPTPSLPIPKLSPPSLPGLPGLGGNAPGSGKTGKTKTAGAGGVVAPAASSSLTAGSATMGGMAYAGVAEVPSRSGTVRMMKFTMNSLTLSGGITLSVSQGGFSVATRGASMSLTGPIVLYATRLSGNLLGVPVTLTPRSPLSVILGVLSPVTGATTLRMTNVVADQPITLASSMRATGLLITAA